MKRFLPLALLAVTLVSLPAKAEDVFPKPDDRVIFDISGEDWVMTKTAHVAVNVEAAVSGSNAGSMRTDMIKAVNDLSKGDWRLTSFNRGQDQTGLERWSATFEARLPENQLNGIEDAAKKASKAGMQLTVSSIDFSPTLDEMEAARGALRAKLYKSALDQLAALNAAIPGRTYRIGLINFSGSGDEPMPRAMRGPMLMGANASAPAASPPMERAEKIAQTAHIILAVAPDKAASAK